VPLLPDQSARVDCLLCRRPPGLCVCDAITRVDNRTGITIVQHPRERSHPFGTARLAHLALARVDVQVAWTLPDGSSSLPITLPAGAALLYPSAHARLLDQTDPPPHLLVLDGSWPLARRIYRHNPWMASLPHVRLEPAAPSAYRVRREPAPHCLSTIESIAAALRVLEPETPHLDQLLTGFTALVERQVQSRGARTGSPRHRSRGQPTARTLLAERWDRVVVACGELAADGSLARWTAVRPTDGTTFDHLSGADLAQAWTSFAGHDALVVTWSETASRGFLAATGLQPTMLPLKSIWHNQARGEGGSLAQIVARLDLPVVAVPVEGGAAGYLADAVALAAHLARRDDRSVL
jgi:DTW domain-containing protein YfiP